MHLDEGRKADLEHLNSVINDPRLPQRQRDHAAQAKAAVLRNAQDPKLAQLRQQMINARKANDQATADKIMNQIQQHEKQPTIP